MEKMSTNNEIFERSASSGEAGEGKHQLHKYIVYLKSGEIRRIEVRNTRHLDSKFGIQEEDVFEVRELGKNPLLYDREIKTWKES